MIQYDSNLCLIRIFDQMADFCHLKYEPSQHFQSFSISSLSFDNVLKIVRHRGLDTCQVYVLFGRL